jgi:site-specific DNA recombinase
VILVEDLSRLTRDMSEVLRLYHRLRLKGIDLVGVSDGIATGSQGAKVHLAVKGLVNELYLDDLRDKTHRGLSGRVARGMSAGGRIFGYRTVPVPEDAAEGRRTPPARYEIDEREAEIVRRVFRDYARGRSMKAIAHALNTEGVPFPAKDTKRGPERRGWAVSTIHVMLQNEKYIGTWVWNKTRFLKDPDSGRRRPVPRPREDWLRQERPELRIIDDALWEAVQARLRFVRAAYGCGPGHRVRGCAPIAYSPHLLSGILRCGVCGARMIAQRFTRKKRDRAYTYSSYTCGFAASKGAAVCSHRVWYRAERLEAALVAKFREALTPPMVDALTQAVNRHAEAGVRAQLEHADRIKAEILRLERQAGNLVRILGEGFESTTVREELQSTETALRGLRAELAEIEASLSPVPPQVDSVYVWSKLTALDGTLRTEPVRAKAEISKHLEELTIAPLPAPEPRRRGEKRAEIRGRVKTDGLLGNQEAAVAAGDWLRGLDLNQRPLGYEPNELPDCSTPRRRTVTLPHPE